MITLFIGLLTFVLVVICLFLILLVLVQLPKKEAGAGIAFGGAATDALFGAGSGNALTKMTKYTAGIFLGLALVLAMLNSQRHNSSVLNVKKQLQSKAATSGGVSIPGLTGPTNNQAATSPAVTNQQLNLSPNAGSLTSPSTGAAPGLILNPTSSTPANAPASGTPAPANQP